MENQHHLLPGPKNSLTDVQAEVLAARAGDFVLAVQ